jgi:hypothetical protein
MRVTHEWDDDHAVIRVDSLPRPVTLLHVADVHLGVIDERDADWQPTCEGLGARFHHRHDNHDSDGRPIPQETAFAGMLQEARGNGVDLLALGGDIVDFPAVANVELARRLLDESGLTWIYTAGNHDWCYLGTPPTDDTRRAWRPALSHLDRGQPHFRRHDVGGLCFLAVDNSTYQIDAEQLEATGAALADGLPTVVMIHVPISLPTLRPAAMAALKGSPCLMADPDWDAEERAEHGVGEWPPETHAFVRLLSHADNLVAVLAGHYHIPHADGLSSTAVQYMAPAGYAGRSRRVRLLPW